MNDTYFLDTDGTPLGGKVPLQAFYEGEGNFEAIKGRANQILQSFLMEIRLGGLQQLVRRVEFPGGELLMRHQFGVTKVLVYALSADTQRTDYFGGILIHPHVVVDPSIEDRYSVDRGEAFTDWQPMNTLKTLKAPSVPGSKDALAEWLVVQIHPTLSLADEPLKKGAVKIFRVHAPKVGDFCEVNAARERYLVSTQNGSEFFVCGKKMDHVPPLPEILRQERFWIPRVRIRSLSLEVPSFEKAHLAEAIIVVATMTKLYLLDTRTRTRFAPATWQLLASATALAGGTSHPFGTEFEETVAEQTTTVRCTGADALGPASGFTVTISQTGLGRGYAGQLLPNYLPPAADDPQPSGSFADTYVEVESPVQVDVHPFVHVDYDDAINGPLHVVPGFPDVLPGQRTYVGLALHDRHVAYKAIGFARTHTASATFPPRPRLFDTLDFFRGRALAGPPPYELEYTEEGECSTTFVGYEFRIKGAGLVWTPLGTGIFDYGQQSVSFSYFTTYPTDPPMLSAHSALHLDSEIGSGSSPSSSELLEYYAPFGGYFSADVGKAYDTTFEISAKYDPWNWGLGSTFNPPAAPTLERGGAVHFQYPLQPASTPYDIYEPRNPFLPVTGLSDPFFEVDDWRWDQQPIHLYPKRAAIFNTYERWKVRYVAKNSIYGAELIVEGERSRAGQLRADEYLARWLPTNVASFPAIAAPVTTVVSNTEVTSPRPTSGTYNLSEAQTVYYSGVDLHTNALAWDVNSPMQANWTHPALPPITDATFASPESTRLQQDVQIQSLALQLLKPEGAPVFTVPDIAAMVPAPTRVWAALILQLGLDPRPRQQMPVVFNDPAYPERDPKVDAEFWPAVPLRSGAPSYRVTPLLMVGYWGRSATGAGLTPPFPEPIAPVRATPITRSATFSGSYFPPVALSPQTAGPLLTRLQVAEGLILRDLRTGGFIGQHVAHFTAGGTLSAAVLHTVIGNASGVVPFAPILAEWIRQFDGTYSHQLLRVMPRQPLGSSETDPRVYKEVSLL